jgi:hypothetical protein
MSADPGDAEAAQLFTRMIGDLQRAVARDPNDAALRDAWRQYGPPPATKRRVPTAVAAAAVAALAAVIAGGFWLTRDPSPPRTEDAAREFKPEPPPVSDTSKAPGVTPPPVTGTPKPAPPPPIQMSALTVNLRPWARVRLRPVASDVETPAPQTTPFTITVPAGEYVLEAENGGLTPPFKVTLRLEGGKVRTISQDMPGFNADRVLDALLGPAR